MYCNADLAAWHYCLIDLGIYNRCCYALPLNCKMVKLPKKAANVSYQIEQNIPPQLTLDEKTTTTTNRFKMKLAFYFFILGF